MQGHRALLERLETWTLRLVFPRPLDRVYDDFQRAIYDEFETPLQPATIGQLRSYFEHAANRPSTAADAFSQALTDRPSGFSASRFTALYRRWRKHGDSALESLASTRLADALANGSGRVESVVLPHSYRHLAPVATRFQRPTESVEKGDEGGDNGPPRPQPPALTPRNSWMHSDMNRTRVVPARRPRLNSLS